MQDRVSQYPGRVKLTPVSGQENVYDMEWADGATVAGTPLNKASLLTDSTASRFGLSSSATVNTVLAKARTLITTAQNTANGVTSRLKVVTGSYTGTGSNSKTISVSGTAQVLVLNYSISNRYSATTVAFNSSPFCALFTDLASIGDGGGRAWAVILNASFSGGNITLSGDISVNNSGGQYKYMVLCT